jgi:hypothetical protein
MARCSVSMSEVVKRSDTRPGFVPIAKRWVVEQVNVTLMLHRRLVREYESRPESSVSRTLWASAANPVRRLTGTSTPSWRWTGVNTTTVLDLIAARQAAASAALNELREQQAKLAAEVAGIECELTDLATTRQTLTKILEEEVTASEPAVIGEPYQQIIAVFTTPDCGALRVKDVCRALGIGTEPKDTEGIRAKQKRLVIRHVLTETEPAPFTLTENGHNPTDRPLSRGFRCGRRWRVRWIVGFGWLVGWF